MWLWLGIWKLCLLIKLKMNKFFRIQWICLFVWWFFFYPIRESFTQMETITGEELCSALMTIEQWGFFRCHTYCRAFGTTCFYDFGLLRLGCDASSFIQWNIREEQHMMKTVLPVYYADHKLVMDKKHEAP